MRLRRLRWTSAVAALTAGFTLIGQVAVLAQTPSTFVPLDQAPQDSVPGGALVVAAYAFAWVAVVAYLFLVWRRAGRIERELSDVRAKIASASRRAG